MFLGEVRFSQGENESAVGNVGWLYSGFKFRSRQFFDMVGKFFCRKFQAIISLFWEDNDTLAFGWLNPNGFRPTE